ncbi:MAG: hypothetical protein NXI10_17845 [bacterium]|nr:hypothetical protein [bacterium]
MNNFRLITVLFSISLFFTACSQEPVNESQKDQISTSQEDEKTSSNENSPHPFGGWYCPDNFNFEPVDISALNQVSAVSGRMPALWETKTGEALIYVDPVKYPEAKPLDIALPTLAFVAHPYADFNELAIIIQAFVVDEDTIVGYRYPNGGNGSARLRDVQVLTPDEQAALSPTPFVFETMEVDASKKDIWKAFTKSTFAHELSKQFDKKELTKAAWSNDLNIDLEFKNGSDFGIGYVANVWGNLYLQVDYMTNGIHSSYKFMVSENADTGKSSVTFVAGPYPDRIENQEGKWKTWMTQLKESSGY